MKVRRVYSPLVYNKWVVALLRTNGHIREYLGDKPAKELPRKLLKIANH